MPTYVYTVYKAMIVYARVGEFRWANRIWYE